MNRTVKSIIFLILSSVIIICFSGTVLAEDDIFDKLQRVNALDYVDMSVGDAFIIEYKGFENKDKIGNDEIDVRPVIVCDTKTKLVFFALFLRPYGNEELIKNCDISFTDLNSMEKRTICLDVYAGYNSMPSYIDNLSNPVNGFIAPLLGYDDYIDLTNMHLGKTILSAYYENGDIIDYTIDAVSLTSIFRVSLEILAKVYFLDNKEIETYYKDSIETNVDSIKDSLTFPQYK